MKVAYNQHGVKLVHGDCVEVMKRLPDNSIDSIVTDPPYAIDFMGKDWDGAGGMLGQIAKGEEKSEHGPQARGGSHNQGFYANDNRVFQAWSERWLREAFRVLKPGGHALVFGATRTWHRQAVAAEDAGFEIRDQIMAWMYGTGFPKGLDISKAIDKAQRGVPQGGANPTSPNHGKYRTSKTEGKRGDSDKGQGYGAGGSRFLASPASSDGVSSSDVKNAVTEEAQKWQGWNTALKPAHEPILVLRKPITEKNIAANVLKYGTGGINIGATRVGSSKQTPASPRRAEQGAAYGDLSNDPGTGSGWDANTGRHPANVVLVHLEECRLVGQTSDVFGGGASASRTGNAVIDLVGGYQAGDGFVGQEVLVDVYECAPGCPVAALDEQAPKAGAGGRASGPTLTGEYKSDMMGKFNGTDAPPAFYGDKGGASRFFYVSKPTKKERVSYTKEDGTTIQHVTVKPLDLMRYLVRMVTPQGGILLDPFAGSGTTLEAAHIEGFKALGIELTDDYIPLTELRIERNQNDSE